MILVLPISVKLDSNLPLDNLQPILTKVKLYLKCLHQVIFSSFETSDVIEANQTNLIGYQRSLKVEHMVNA